MKAKARALAVHKGRCALTPRAIRLASTHSAAARGLINELSATLSVLTGGCFSIAYALPDSTALGWGALQPLTPAVVELKRLYARRGTRGAGGALLWFLEQQACAGGYQ